MKKTCLGTLLLLCCTMYSGYILAQTEGASDNMLISGFKEALSIGTEKAVQMVSKTDGFFGNQAIKILMPDKMKMVADALAKAGMQKQVDDFVLSMNRAAEKAAPLAADIFTSAISEMSFDDANKILQGGNTAATDYLKGKTYNKLLTLFEPEVRKTMGEYKVTQQYDAITGKVQNLPLIGKAINLDVNQYVSGKALDGLFYMLAKEEADIRTNPKARVTSLLKEVFK